MEPNPSLKTAPEYRSSDDRLRPTRDEPTIINENRARQAVPLGHMRYVLGISLALVIGGFLAFYWLPWS
jgi:hypothetical protein